MSGFFFEEHMKISSYEIKKVKISQNNLRGQQSGETLLDTASGMLGQF